MDQIPQDGVLLEPHPAAGANTYEVRNPDGVWPTPGAEVQRSLVDSMACVSYSAVHCIESQIKYLTGRDVNYSERFVAKMSGTTHQGNYQSTVLNTIRQFGLVADQDWPEPATFDWNTFYADIPQSVIDKGQEFLKQFTIDAKWVPEAEVAQALKEAPLQAIITSGNPTHSVENYAEGKYFDTYIPYLKPLPGVHDYLLIKLTPKDMSQTATQNNKGELRIVLKASTPEQWAALCAVYGKDPNTIDEIV